MQNLGVACIRRPLCPGFRRRLHCLRNAQSAPFPPLTQAALARAVVFIPCAVAQSCPLASFEHYFAFFLLVAFSNQTHEPAGWLARAVVFIPCANAQPCPLASFKGYFALVLLVAFSYETHEPANWLARAVAFIPCAAHNRAHSPFLNTILRSFC